MIFFIKFDKGRCRGGDFLDANLSKCDEMDNCNLTYSGSKDNVIVRSVYAETDAPDIRECLALFLLEREYGMNEKLQIRN